MTHFLYLLRIKHKVDDLLASQYDIYDFAMKTELKVTKCNHYCALKCVQSRKIRLKAEKSTGKRKRLIVYFDF